MKGFGAGLGLLLGNEVTAVETQILEAFRALAASGGLAASGVLTMSWVIRVLRALEMGWLHMLLGQPGPALPS